jgi:hypothetical protein
MIGLNPCTSEFHPQGLKPLAHRHLRTNPFLLAHVRKISNESLERVRAPCEVDAADHMTRWLQERPTIVSTKHLNQIDLSRRWNVSERTLERWRWLRQGPKFLKIGGAVRYRIEDVEAYECLQQRDPKAVDGMLR